jgi:hypothetical protein
MIRQAVTVLLSLSLLGMVAVGMVYVSMALFTKAVRDVVRLFRRRGATAAVRAATVEELDLVPRPITQRMFMFRDYRPYALQTLMDVDVVRATGEGSLYLSEAELARSWGKGAGRDRPT